MKAMVLAAGLGTRLKPFTDKHPKALAVVNGKTLLQHSFEYLLSSDVSEIIVNVHAFANQIEDLLGEKKGFGSSYKISDERDELLETGGGLIKAKWFFENDDAPFVLMNVDIMTDLDLKKMAAAHTKADSIATLAVRQRKTSRYFLFDKNNQLCGWRNTKTGAEKISRQADAYFEKAFSGIQILSPRIFPHIHRQGKFSMVDAYLDLAKEFHIQGYEHNDSRFIDVGKPESIAEAEKLFPV